MELTVNGESRSFDEPLTVSDLLNQLGLKQDRVAVEHNRKLLARTEWLATLLAHGDSLEIVQFVGGGGTAPQPDRLSPTT